MQLQLMYIYNFSTTIQQVSATIFCTSNDHARATHSEKIQNTKD